MMQSPRIFRFFSIFPDCATGWMYRKNLRRKDRQYHTGFAVNAAVHPISAHGQQSHLHLKSPQNQFVHPLSSDSGIWFYDKQGLYLLQNNRTLFNLYRFYRINFGCFHCLPTHSEYG